MIDLRDSDEEDAYYNPHAMPKEFHYGIPNTVHPVVHLSLF